MRQDHRSSYAWANGWTGEGVRVAVPDEGVDFAHPDLQGTEATVPASVPEFAGWPLAFDPYSCLALATDDQLGTHYVANGQTWFSSTSATLPVSAETTFQGLLFRTDDLPTPSLSGVVHIGLLNDANLQMLSPSSDYQRPAVLVVDAHTPGVYDTVYVDLNFDRYFGDDKPCAKGSGDAPISYLDYWDSAHQTAYPDGYADVSGGMVYWIATGDTAPPGYSLEFGSMNSTPGAGDMVAFMGALDYGSDHGTLCGSNVVGRGVIDGPSFAEGPASVPAFKGAGTGGMVQGAGLDATLVSIGDVYKNFEVSAMMSWDFSAVGPDGLLGSGDESQIVSNSFGESGISDSEWDLLSRYMVSLNTVFAPETTFMVSTGNGGPGYGTVTPPRPTTGISVGASTQYGSFASPMDSAVTTDQITYGDVAPFSNRGPSAMGHNGVDVLADGSVASGDEPLNMAAGDGWTAWLGWSGTSRSCPTAAGNLALVYQAYRDTHAGAWPTYELAREFLMSGAADSGNDTFVQGAGRVNAERSTDLASDARGVSVSPSTLTPGSWEGTSYPGYASVIPTGGSAPATLTVTNHGSAPVTVSVEPSVLERTTTETFSVTLDPAQLSPYRFDRPDWISDDLSSRIPTDTDLVVFRVRMPMAALDPSGMQGMDWTNGLRTLVYDWTDVNHDGELWHDLNGNGFVNDPGYSGPEIQSGEYVRFVYSNNTGPTSEVRVAEPHQRMHDGIFFGLQLAQVPDQGIERLGDPVPVTVEMSCWKRTSATGLVEVQGPASFPVAAGGSEDVALTAHAPQAVGTYEASIRVSDGTTTTVVPVAITAAANSAQFRFGGSEDTTSQLMPNGAVLGMQDWSWRPEAGDWRMFMADVPAAPTLPPGAKWVVHTSWESTPTDLDTQMWGPIPPYLPVFAPWFESPAYTDFVGPGELAQTGGSMNTNTGYGGWVFDTATGGPAEWVAGDLRPGLNMLQVHNVISTGASVATTFTGDTGVMSIDPSAVSLTTKTTSGHQAMGLSTSIDIQQFNGRGWALSPVYDRFNTIRQDQDQTREFELKDAGYLDVRTFNDTGSDVDLMVLRWDDTIGDWSLVGMSAGATGNETVRVSKPADGRYLVDVFGYDVRGGIDSYRLRIANPQGVMPVTGFPTGSVPAGTTMTASAAWSVSRGTLDQRDATWEGIAGFGPALANQLLATTIDVSYPFYVASSQPATGAVWPRGSALTATLSRRADPASVTSANVYVTAHGSSTPLAGMVSYDDATAAIHVNGVTMAKSAAYTLHVTSGVTAVDGTPLPDTAIPFTTDASKTTRVAGANRYDTALKAVRSRFTSASSVVLASGASYPDALAASGLCGALHAPLLLTSAEELSPGVMDEIDALGAADVYIVGGSGAVSDSVASELEWALGQDHVVRVAGLNRYDTAAQVATKIRSIEGTTPIALVTRGDDFADALSAAPVADAKASPVLFVSSGAVPPATSDALTALNPGHAYVLGGTGAVSDSVLGQIRGIVGTGNASRLGGSDRYDTSRLVATTFTGLGYLSWPHPALASGTDYPDGLAGGVVAGADGAPLLLTRPADLPSPVAGVMTSNKATVQMLTIFGGTGAVSDQVQNQAEAALK